MKSPRWPWLLWAAATALLAAGLASALALHGVPGDADEAAAAAPLSAWQLRLRTWFLPGDTSHGHHQIELQCESCHRDAFGSREVLQDACTSCHGADLKTARDTHPRSKFTDPRNAERAARLDAVWCVTCHVEHKPGLTQPMGVTLPEDFCVICHRDVGDDRPSHVGLAMNTCASAGCHNFHDNRALYEDFLLKHAQDPAQRSPARVPTRDFATLLEEFVSYPATRFPLQPLQAADAAGRAHLTPAIGADWLASGHAKQGVGCAACHVPGASTAEPTAGPWVERPGPDACAGCHGAERRGFGEGKHGMRLQAGLPAMMPALAKLPMKAQHADAALGCGSCHDVHKPDTRRAAVQACQGCHDDEHTRAYAGSRHAALWQAEVDGQAPAGSGVSCATCHLPRVEHRTDDVRRVLVQHNQNDNLRPNEKMLRSVCQNCHGLPFAIDALADAALVRRNFSGPPQVHVDSVAMAVADDARARAERERARAEQAAQDAAASAPAAPPPTTTSPPETTSPPPSSRP